jgi:lysozyme family protein
MSAFDKAFASIDIIEGGYSNRDKSADPGGATNHGVTERVARKWGYTGDMRDLPTDVARQIAKTEYWDQYHCDQLPDLLAYQVFDTAYNGGYPIKWLQECLGVTADGIIGARTIAAARACDQWKVIALFNSKRIGYLTNLNNWPQNAKGWARRIAFNLSNGA